MALDTLGTDRDPAQERLRLRWACRRGMRELDLWLQSFLEKAWLNLSAEEKADFERLLKQQDQDLFDWLMQNAQPTDPSFRLLLDKIRNNTASGD